MKMAIQYAANLIIFATLFYNERAGQEGYAVGRRLGRQLLLLLLDRSSSL